MRFSDKIKFKQILKGAIDLIADTETKNKGQVEKELGDIVGKTAATVHSWIKPAKDSPMPDGNVIKTLAKEIWKRNCYPPKITMEDFLAAAGFPNAKDLSDQLIEECKKELDVNSGLISENEVSQETIETYPKADQLKGFSLKRVLIAILLIFLIIFIIAGINIFSFALDDVRLATWYGEPVVLEVNGAPDPNGRQFNSGDEVTASFTILNHSSHIIVIRTLVLGTNGPGVSCTDSMEKRWNNQGRYSFRPEFFIVLLPEQEHKYKVSRTFTEEGAYFAEPVIQSFIKTNNNDWGGIQPFSCVDFTVGD
jgi:hypothetical protein